jgi:DNA-binding NtrC family response regulator
MDLAQTFTRAGARVVTTRLLREALQLVESDSLAAAVLDHALGDGDSSQLCARLKERDIPFVLYSGHSEIKGACHDAPFVAKPSKPDELVSTVEDLLTRRSTPI